MATMVAGGSSPFLVYAHGLVHALDTFCGLPGPGEHQQRLG